MNNHINTLTYNFHEAINMRGKTLNDVGLYDVETMRPDLKFQVIDFKESLAITSNLKPTEFDWGNIPSHILILGDTVGYDQNKLRATITKSEWKRCNHQYRCYMRQCYDVNEIFNS